MLNRRRRYTQRAALRAISAGHYYDSEEVASLSTQSQFQNMSGDQIISRSKKAWQQISDKLPSQSQKNELGQTLTELCGRVEFVTKGQRNEQPTPYSGLDATALAYHARSVAGRITRDLPVDLRDQASVVYALADRIEYASMGSPSEAHQHSEQQSTTGSFS